MYCDSAAVLPSLLLSETLREREATPSAWQLLETLRVACFSVGVPLERVFSLGASLSLWEKGRRQGRTSGDA